MTKDEALDKALEAFVRAERDGYWSRDTAIAVEAIKQARSAPVAALDRIKEALPEFRQQDDYLLAHGASLLSEHSHEIIHIDTALRIAEATPPAAPVQEPSFWVVRLKDQKMVDLFFEKEKADEWVLQFRKGWAWVEPLYTAAQPAPVQEPSAWLIPGSITTDPELAKANGDKAVALGKISKQQWNPEDHYKDGWRDALESVKRATPPAQPCFLCAGKAFVVCTHKTTCKSCLGI